jgi:CRP-like cAMP-binding protein
MRQLGVGWMIDSHRYCVAFTTSVRRYWDDLRAFTRTDSFQRKEIIYSVGDPPDAIYLIESGQVKVVQLSADGEEKIIGLYQKRDLFVAQGLYSDSQDDLQDLRILSIRRHEKVPDLPGSIGRVSVPRVA